MQQFLSVLQNYMAHQIIAVSWDEFQAKLAHVTELESLRRVHTTYLKKILFRYEPYET